LNRFSELLYRPLTVLVVAALLSVSYLLYDGSFWKLWSLNRNYKEMSRRIGLVQEETLGLRFKVEEATKTSFIERQATEQLGLVREDDLVFVFSSDD
ncbi:MAG: hypothetical protein IT287_06565, partial [Bdellovibrionaceae bacterium]|nr:hypothetical protein [Pseudobdellovibrionaceae bacterium]